MSDRSQLLKGILEGCLLKIIQDEQTYGYEIVEKLRSRGFHEACEGTVYPLLLRLEKNGLLTSSKKESPYGPMRKYYALSLKGEQELVTFHRHWNEISACVGNVFHNEKGRRCCSAHRNAVNRSNGF